MLTGLRRRLELLLELALSQAEDPEERIRSLVADLKARRAAGKRALGLTLSLEKRLLDELVAAEDAAQACERDAKDALSRGDQNRAADLAARLLQLRKREREAKLGWEEQRALADKLRKAFAEATRRTDEVAHAHTVLLARAPCA